MEPEEYMVWTNTVFILLLEYFTFMENENSIIQFSLTFYIWIQSIFQYDKKQLHHFCFRQLLTAVLQFMLSVSAHKSQVLLYRLDVNLLGKSSASKVY